MTVQVILNETKKIGTCPHGNPAGACPLCSGGGGLSKLADHDTRRRPGELTWNECYAIGQMLKQRALEKKHAEEQALLNKTMAEKNSLMTKIAGRISALNSAILARISKMAAAIKNVQIKNIIPALANSIKALNKFIPQPIRNFIQNVQQKMADISDKLAALLGEMKNAIEKNISDRMKSMLEKFTSLFGFAKSESATNEDEQNSEKERILKYKKVERKQLSQDNMQNNDDSNQEQKEEQDN